MFAFVLFFAPVSAGWAELYMLQTEQPASVWLLRSRGSSMHQYGTTSCSAKRTIPPSIRRWSRPALSQTTSTYDHYTFLCLFLFPPLFFLPLVSLHITVWDPLGFKLIKVLKCIFRFCQMVTRRKWERTEWLWAEDRRLGWPSPELFTWSVRCTNLPSAHSAEQHGRGFTKQVLVCRKRWQRIKPLQNFTLICIYFCFCWSLQVEAAQIHMYINQKDSVFMFNQLVSHVPDITTSGQRHLPPRWSVGGGRYWRGRTPHEEMHHGAPQGKDQNPLHAPLRVCVQSRPGRPHGQRNDRQDR